MLFRLVLTCAPVLFSTFVRLWSGWFNKWWGNFYSSRTKQSSGLEEARLNQIWRVQQAYLQTQTFPVWPLSYLSWAILKTRKLNSWQHQLGWIQEYTNHWTRPSLSFSNKCYKILLSRTHIWDSYPWLRSETYEISDRLIKLNNEYWSFSHTFPFTHIHIVLSSITPFLHSLRGPVDSFSLV